MTCVRVPHAAENEELKLLREQLANSSRHAEDAMLASQREQSGRMEQMVLQLQLQIFRRQTPPRRRRGNWPKLCGIRGRKRKRWRRRETDRNCRWYPLKNTETAKMRNLTTALR